ncbi:class I SAM-dependent methyltransferase [Pseudoalteromonas sp. M8]|uniref:class I SAM-dependent methyltransferase n=1 Tax=Pseudoalteromonas sp. M8 TaxID=2692624 RepID=UPI001BA9FF76|nr:class I SAM-dependent methyltransferase [Pseudoalteromonas sp. M8]QUI72018.1 methyltransferase domain-containing protein [Pseudoalteromonas sp. M8]
MHQNEVKELFDKQAETYDQQWSNTAPIRHCMHLLLRSVFADLPVNANILCIGVGTGDELLYLASNFPNWQFTAVEPSGPMLDICKKRAKESGVDTRCIFHEGYLHSMPFERDYHAATCFLVSQFILQEERRSAFFGEIAERLKPEGLMASADLSSDIDSPDYDKLLDAWVKMMSMADVSQGTLERMRDAYANDVGILSPPKVCSIIQAGGFELPIQFFQAGLIHAWITKRA